MRKLIIPSLVLVTLFATPLMAEEVSAELQASVPALSALHEQVSPLWHDAWPNKNMELIRKTLPDLSKGVQAVSSAKLPGILRDKTEAWKDGVAMLERALAATELAAAANEEQGMLDGVEAVHAAFEGLIRVVRPPMKELDAYHQVLYTLYHKAVPASDLGAIRTAGEELGRKCDALLAAPLPRRAAGREEAVKKALESLCASTSELRAVPKDADKETLTAAVEKLHVAYMSSEAAFESK